MSNDKYNHLEVEDKIYKYWENHKLFKPKKSKKNIAGIEKKRSWDPEELSWVQKNINCIFSKCFRIYFLLSPWLRYSIMYELDFAKQFINWYVLERTCASCRIISLRNAIFVTLDTANAQLASASENPYGCDIPRDLCFAHQV